MPATLLRKAGRYHQLHASPRAFVAGGCWDAGSALLLAHAGLEVLETNSAGGQKRSDPPPRPGGDRIRAAAEAAGRLPFPFALTARADQYMHKRPDLAGAIRRAWAFRLAGADMILVPGLTGRGEVEALGRSVDCLVAAVVGLSNDWPTLATLGALGVRRVIVGSSLARIAYTGLPKAAREMTDAGTFDFAPGLMAFDGNWPGRHAWIRRSGAP